MGRVGAWPEARRGRRPPFTAVLAAALAAACTVCGPTVAEAACLPNATTERKLFTYKGKDYSFQLGAGMWNNPGPIAEIIRILLEERLGVSVTVNKFPSSEELLKQVLGCTNKEGDSRNMTCTDPAAYQDPPLKSWYSIDVWGTAATEAALFMQAGPSSAMGYRTLPGLYTQQRAIDNADKDNHHLMWWEAYKEDGEPHAYFTSVAELDAAIKSIDSFSSSVCPTGRCPAGTIRPMCNPSIPSASLNVQEMAEHNLTCDDGWWYSPACVNSKEKCIPVVLGEYSWNMVDWCKSLLRMNLPMAVTWVGWFQEVNVVQDLSEQNMTFLFYWWEPDSTFFRTDGSRPEQVRFDDRYLRISQVLSTVGVPWVGLKDVAPDVYTLLRTQSLTNADVQGMMFRQAQNKSMSDYDIACEWLLDPMNTKSWNGWMPVVREVYIPTIQVEQVPAGDNVTLVAVLSTLACVVVLAGIVYRTYRWWTVLVDSPGDATTPSGAWVAKWLASQYLPALTETASPARKGWLVNGSPFVVHVSSGNARNLIPIERCHKLLPLQYCRGMKDFDREQVTIYISFPDVPVNQWLRPFPNAHRITILQSDWTTSPTSKDSTDAAAVIKYADPIVRKDMHLDDRQRPFGQIKISRCSHVVLIQWSPPPQLRGVPIGQFEHFLAQIAENGKMWEKCKEVEHGVLKAVADTPPRSSQRNMYDANRFVIRPQIALYDASYAELKTHCGPPQLFISHVWGETAQNTKDAIHKLYNFLYQSALARSATGEILRTAPTQSFSPTLTAAISGKTFEDSQVYRVWFCTICNNQSRVAEELGDNTDVSPFAVVLRSTSVKQVALISPFKALHRKWCNYEFCFARHEQKSVVMLTEEGVVQAGHVCPSNLAKLARKVVDFDCRDATCTTATDERFIDAAVERMGGYEELTSTLKDVFRVAIFEAYQLLDQAVAVIGHPDKVPENEFMMTLAEDRRDGDDGVDSNLAESAANSQNAVAL